VDQQEIGGEFGLGYLTLGGDLCQAVAKTLVNLWSP
jgi:hypothetical protein